MLCDPQRGGLKPLGLRILALVQADGTSRSWEDAEELAEQLPGSALKALRGFARSSCGHVMSLNDLLFYWDL